MNKVPVQNGYQPWGKSVAINLFDCDHNLVSDPEAIKKFVTEVIKVIDMVAHGQCHIERFGSGDLEGYSAIQFIETSSITVHCDEFGNRAFIDIFSCKDFDDQKASEFSENYFKAKKSKHTTLTR